MILTNCAACAAPLAHTAPRCVRCQTRYCNATRTRYADALYKADRCTLEDLREAVETFEEIERIARRVLGANHPMAGAIERQLQTARAALRAREETPLRTRARG